MATEISRLGVVYSPGVHILSQSARGAILSETRRIEAAQEPHLAQLKVKFKDKLRERWNKFQVNQMLLSWERQEKAGLELWTVFRRMPSRWGF